MAKTTYNLHLKGFVGGWDFDSDYVDFVLNKNADKEVAVLIDSLAGKLNTALSISSAFRRHGNVHVHFVGMNASAATIASMGAKRISMDRSAMYLVHQCSQSFFEWGSLNATDMQNLINNLEKQKAQLDKFDANVAEMYATRCKKKSADLLDLMKEGGWLTAQEALAWGFVDEITEYEDEQAPVINDAVVAECKAHNIPITTSFIASTSEENREELTAIRRFFLSFSKLFHSQEQQVTNDDTKPHTIMNKIYKNICKVLACETITTEEDKSTLTTAQLDSLETEFEARDKMIASLTEKVNDLTKSKETLEAKLANRPADTTNDVVDDKKDSSPKAELSDIEKFYQTTNSAQALYDSLP